MKQLAKPSFCFKKKKGFGETLLTLTTHPLTPMLMETCMPVLAWKKPDLDLKLTLIKHKGKDM